MQENELHAEKFNEIRFCVVQVKEGLQKSLERPQTSVKQAALCVTSTSILFFRRLQLKVPVETAQLATGGFASAQAAQMPKVSWNVRVTSG